MLKLFADKMWVAKATHIFSAKKCESYSYFFSKNIRILYIESSKTVNEMTLNELVKLTTLWTTGPRLKRLPSSFPTNCSKAVPLLQFFFACASVVSYEAFVFFLICSSYLLLSKPQEGCALWFGHFLCIFIAWSNCIFEFTKCAQWSFWSDCVNA